MGYHSNGRITKKCDAALGAGNLLLKFGSDADHVAVTTAATEKALGFSHSPTDAAEDVVGVELTTAPGTKEAVASAAIAVGTFFCPAADGKIQAVPVTAGTYYICGRTLQAAGAANAVIEVETCMPYAVVVTGT